MLDLQSFDKLVGRVAGAIYSGISKDFPHPPLLLLPGVTFKVRRMLEQVTNIELLSPDQKAELAKDIRIAIVPLLFSFDIEGELIEKIAPIIEQSARKGLT